MRDDPNLLAALPGEDQQKSRWLAEFKKITHMSGQPATHSLAKQIYYFLGAGTYHLLAPLFPSSLAHVVYDSVQTRFSEEVQNARKAFNKDQFYEAGFYSYPNLVLSKFGGTKPQNISLLNSQRGGKAYLLSSLPPEWHNHNQVVPPLTVKSVMPQFKKRVGSLLYEFKSFLENIPRNNFDLRKIREDYTQKICDQFIDFAAEFQALEPGWSAQQNCKLSLYEQFWLDPDRDRDDEVDSEWRLHRQREHWQVEIEQMFAGWLNKNLSGKLQFNDPEYEHWQKCIRTELSKLAVGS